MHTERAFTNHHIWSHWGDLGHDQVTVFLTTVVTRVKDFETCNDNEEHGSTKDMTGVIGRKVETSCNANILVVVDCDDGLPRRRDVCLSVESA